MRRVGYIPPESTVLDVGCGLGRTARALTKVLSGSGRYYGIDITKSSIDWCIANYKTHPNFTFIFADLFSNFYNRTAKGSAATYKFPLDDSSVDFTYSTSLFTHMLLDQIDNYLSEMRRTLKIGGYVWNSYLLLDDFAEAAARADPPGKSRVIARIPVEGGFATLPDNPEARVAFRLERILELHAKHSFEVADVMLGPWSGRTENVRAGNQDVIVARRVA
jgi:SAM-dependent methyltransferase